MDNGVLVAKVVSASSLDFTTCSASLTGMLVNNAVKSYEMILLHGSTSSSCTRAANSELFLIWCSDKPTSGDRISESAPAALCVMVPVPETMGLSGVLALWILGWPYSFGGSTSVG